MFGLGKKRDAAGDAEAFWSWFAGAAPQLAKDYDAFVRGETGPEPLIVPVAERLDAYCDGIVHEIGQDEDGVYDLVISADGIKDRIETVTALTRAAPAIDGWKVTAFRPRKSIGDTMLQMGGVDFRAGDILYRLGEPHDGLCDIKIRFRADLEAPAEALIGPAFIIMDSVIGEYDVMTKIGEVDPGFIKPEDAADGLRPITELAGDIDARFPQAAN